jgi:hypothetical protein
MTDIATGDGRITDILNVLEIIWATRGFIGVVAIVWAEAVDVYGINGDKDLVNTVAGVEIVIKVCPGGLYPGSHHGPFSLLWFSVHHFGLVKGCCLAHQNDVDIVGPVFIFRPRGMISRTSSSVANRTLALRDGVCGALPCDLAE